MEVRTEIADVIKSLRWLSEELRDEKRGMEAKICRVAADRLDAVTKVKPEPTQVFSDRKCPKCGGTSGFYTKGEYWHYYLGEGYPDGYDFVSESNTAICLDCGRRTKLALLFGEEVGGE